MHTIDAKNKVVGRVATEAAYLLRAKNDPAFQSHVMPKQKVQIINVAHVKISGNKEKSKIYKSYSGYPGGLKETSYERAFAKSPRKVLEHAIHGMMPKNKLAKRIMRENLVIYEKDA